MYIFFYDTLNDRNFYEYYLGTYLGIFDLISISDDLFGNLILLGIVLCLLNLPRIAMDCPASSSWLKQLVFCLEN